MHQMEAGHDEQALFTLLGLDASRAASFRGLLKRGSEATYRDALAILCLDAEAENFLYRFTDPTYLMAEALLRGLGQNRALLSRPVLDLCGGSGHLTRVLAGLKPAGGVVDADVYFWKLWMAKRFMVPGCDPICCDANSPLPFARDVFSLAVLADAFPYIWHKRMLAEDMMRLVGPDGVIVMPHLHSSLGENFSAGMTLSPAGYRDLFAAQQPHLFSDERLYRGVLEHRTVDLSQDASPEVIGNEPSLTLVAGRHSEIFRKYDVPDAQEITGTLTVNPLYDVEVRDGSSLLTLTFPTPEYEEEFGACKEYLPSRLTVPADLTRPIVPAMLGPDASELRRRRVIIDAPPHYC
jgi:SAM-dependent methyltransferase